MVLSLPSAWGANYTVNADGSGAFPTIQACANAARPGDTCLVSPGNYPEYVVVPNSGTATSPITIAAVYPANVSTTLANQKSTVKGFRIKGAYVTINGFDITKYDVGLSFGHITVEATGAGCRLTNNVIRDGIWRTSSKYYFDAAAHTITDEDGGFIAAGFVPGVRVYIGSNINALILNHDTIKQVTAVTDKMLTVSDVDSGVANWQMSTEGPVQSTIFVTRADKNGVTGIHFNLSSATGPAGCTISSNKLTNLAGAGILTIAGNNTVIEDNVLDNMHGWRFITLNGSNNVFRRNVFKDSPRWDGFPAPEVGVYHSPGVGTGDMYSAFIYSTATQTTPVVNNVFEQNFVKDIANSLTQIEYLGTTGYGSGIIFRSNVFVGVESVGSLHYPQTQVVNNTFVNSSLKSAHNFILADSIHGSPTGSTVKNNVFVGNGKAPDPVGQAGWYTVQASVMATPPDHDFVAGPAADGYPAKAEFAGAETNGINGGNPQFQNINDPLGPDGIAFTDDDGLKPLPASPLCGHADDGRDIGAYSCAVSGSGSPTPGGGSPTPGGGSPTTTETIPGKTYTVGSAGTGDYTTIQACVNVAKAGDMCLIQPGTYPERVNTVTGGTDDAHRVIVRANGNVTMQGFTIKHPYVSIEGFDITGYAVQYSGAVAVTSTGNYCRIVKNNIHDLAANISGIWMLSSASAAASNCVVSGNTLSRLNYPMLNVNGDNHLFENNVLSENNNQDFIRLLGSGTTFRHNVFWKGTAPGATGQHPDLMQTFGGATIQSQNHVFEENWISDLAGATQFGQFNSGDGVVSKGILYTNVKNIIFRGNVIANVPLNANINMPGVRFENNTFLKMATAGTGIIFGGSLTRGDPASGSIVNNIFLNGGTGASGSGYYAVVGVQYSLEVIGVLVTGEGVCQSTCAIASGIFADLKTNGYIGTNGVILSRAISLTDTSQLVLNSAYDAYRQKVFDTLTASVQMDNNARNTFYADYNFVYPQIRTGPCETGRYYASPLWCEQHGINGVDGRFANLSNLLGPDGIPFTLDDGLKPAADSPVCGSGVGGTDIGAYSCDPKSVFYRSTGLLPPTNLNIVAK